MFNSSIYKLFNNDLKKLNNNLLFLHWKTNGQKENRIYDINSFFQLYPTFNLNEYIQLYPSIKDYDDIIIMSHYHHNNEKNLIEFHQNVIHHQYQHQSKNKQIIQNNDKQIIQNKYNLLNDYLQKYYIFNNEFRICYIAFNETILNYHKMNDYPIYLFFDICNKENKEKSNSNVNSNVNIIHINIHNIYQIQEILLNLQFDYFYFVFDNHISINFLDYLNKNPLLLINNKNLLIHKKILTYYSYFYIFSLFSNNHSLDNFKNIIKINDEQSFNNYKFYNIINNTFIENENENNKINKLIQLYSIHCLDINNINHEMIEYILKKMLFFDLKKNIIFIFGDDFINETFIIHYLKNIDFENSIVITYNIQKIKNKYKLFDSICYTDFFELFNEEKYKIDDLLIYFGFFVDYYIGHVNIYSKVWNYLNKHLLLFLNKFDNEYIHNKNICINNSLNAKNNLYLNNCIIEYNQYLFLINNQNLFEIGHKGNYVYSFEIDFYMNEYIYNYYFDNNTIIYDELNIDNYIFTKNINTYMYLIENNNNYYYKLFDSCCMINNNFIIDTYKKYSIVEDVCVNKMNIFHYYVFIFVLEYKYQLQSQIFIDYIYDFFNKYYGDLNYKIEFYIKNETIDTIENKNLNKILNKNIKLIKHNDEILIDLLKKYNKYDFMFYFKNDELLYFDIQKDILYFFIQDKLFLDRNNYVCFNLYLFHFTYTFNELDNKYFSKLLNINYHELMKKIYYQSIDYEIDKFINNSYFNECEINKYDFNKCEINKCEINKNNSLLLKFLLYCENDRSILNDINSIYSFLIHDENENYINIKNKIKYIIYNPCIYLLYIYDLNNNVSTFEIDNIQFNIMLNKLNNDDLKIIYCFQNNKNNIDNINNIDLHLNNEVIFDENKNLLFMILTIQSLKKIGYLHYSYFSNQSITYLNLTLYYELLKFNTYQINYDNNKLIQLDFIQLLDELQLNNYLGVLKNKNKNQDINKNKIQYINHFIPIRKIINLNNNYLLNHIFNSSHSLINIQIINLKNRVDKRQFMINQMNRLNITHFDFFDAFKIKKNDFTEIKKKYKFIQSEKFLNFLNLDYVVNSSGCKISHYELIKSLEFKESNHKYTLILEDDAVLETNFYAYLLHAFCFLHNNFDLLYLGCNLNKKEEGEIVHSNILKVSNPKTTTAYLIQNSTEKRNKILNAIEHSHNEIDNTYAENNNLLKYCIYPMIAYQKDYSSDIIDDANYQYYHDKFNF